MASTRTNMLNVLYCLFKNVFEPSLIAFAISCMCLFPAGSCLILIERYPAKTSEIMAVVIMTSIALMYSLFIVFLVVFDFYKFWWFSRVYNKLFIPLLVIRAYG